MKFSIKDFFSKCDQIRSFFSFFVNCISPGETRYLLPLKYCYALRNIKLKYRIALRVLQTRKLRTISGSKMSIVHQITMVTKHLLSLFH